MERTRTSFKSLLCKWCSGSRKFCLTLSSSEYFTSANCFIDSPASTSAAAVNYQSINQFIVTELMDCYRRRIPLRVCDRRPSWHRRGCLPAAGKWLPWPVRSVCWCLDWLIKNKIKKRKKGRNKKFSWIWKKIPLPPLTAAILARDVGLGCRNSFVFICSSSTSSYVMSVFCITNKHKRLN